SGGKNREADANIRQQPAHISAPFFGGHEQHRGDRRTVTGFGGGIYADSRPVRLENRRDLIYRADGRQLSSAIDREGPIMKIKSIRSQVVRIPLEEPLADGPPYGRSHNPFVT